VVGDAGLHLETELAQMRGAYTTTGRIKLFFDRVKNAGGIGAAFAREVSAAISPGSTAPLTPVKVKTVASEDDPKSSALKVTVGRGYEFPVKVSLKISSLIGGPSAGTMFALAIYDTLTPGSLTGGGDVAGTGEIDAQGHVGGIGGIQQKLAAAQAAGATLFLAPASNCDEVKGGPYDPDKMRVVKISTLAGAIQAVKAWRQNPDAKLPQC